MSSLVGAVLAFASDPAEGVTVVVQLDLRQFWRQSRLGAADRVSAESDQAGQSPHSTLTRSQHFQFALDTRHQLLVSAQVDRPHAAAEPKAKPPIVATGSRIPLDKTLSPQRAKLGLVQSQCT
jgi:hypothetical protein